MADSDAPGIRRSLVLAVRHLGPLVQVAQAAEAAGFHRVWTTEGTGGDSMARAMHLAAHTRSIRLASGIAYAFTRPPLAMAALAADIQEASGGRFSLGVGLGTRGVRERRYGIVFDHPAPRMAEYLDAVRTVLRADNGVSYKGRFYEIDFPQLDLPQPRGLRERIELWAAALLPTMTQHVAAAADGVAIHALAIYEPYLRGQLLPAVQRGTEKAGRRPQLAMWQITAVGDSEEQATALARRQLAFYFQTPSYGPVVAGGPWADVCAEIREEAKRRQYRELDEVGRLVPDAMVAEFCVTGTRATAPGRLRAAEARLAAAGIDEVALQIVGGATPEETLSNALAVVAAGAREVRA